MKSFVCKIDAPFRTENNEELKIEIKNSQLWYMQFDSSATMALFFDWLSKKIEFYYTAEGRIIFNNSPIIDNPKPIQLIRYKIKSEENLFYYQQRYHATENDEVIQLRDYLGNINSSLKAIIQNSLLKDILDEPVNELSSGEFKVACSIKALNANTPVIFLEDPFAGLDRENRALLIELLESLKDTLNISIVIGSLYDLPVNLFDYIIKIPDTNRDSSLQSLFQNDLRDFSFDSPEYNDFSFAFDLSNIKIQYQNKIILNNINWKVKKNEKWALTGKNGAGKSMLLSLINADHPQAYSNDIKVFDKSRGQGLNIWDIKENIGFYSHEFFRYYDKTDSVKDTILSLTNGNPYKKKNNATKVLQKLEKLLPYFDISLSVEDKSLYQLPQYQQRLIVLLGIFLKNAPLLILDEPYHFFDRQTVKKFNFLIDNYLTQRTIVFVSHIEEDYPQTIEHYFSL
jgi:molybdate transport system ATP-binding protein